MSGGKTTIPASPPLPALVGWADGAEMVVTIQVRVIEARQGRGVLDSVAIRARRLLEEKTLGEMEYQWCSAAARITISQNPAAPTKALPPAKVGADATMLTVEQREAIEAFKEAAIAVADDALDGAPTEKRRSAAAKISDAHEKLLAAFHAPPKDPTR